MKLFISLSALGFLAVAATVPATAGTINLNTGDGNSPYTITSDTLNPYEGTTVYLATAQATRWLNDLSSEWIAPMADQSNANTNSVLSAGSVTYDTTFILPTGFTNGSLNITLEADDWATISLNGNLFYTGPDTGEWKFDTTIPISAAVNNELVSGLNTLQFVVYNTGGGTDAGGGPTGLDAQVSVNYSAAVPEPSTALPVAMAVLIGGFLLRRTRLAA